MPDKGYIHQFQPGPTLKFQTATETTSLNIPSRRASLKWSQRHEISHKLCSENVYLFLSVKEIQCKLRQQNDQNFLMEERNISRRARLWESQSGIRVRKLTIWVRPFETKNYNRVKQVYQFNQNRLTSP